VAGLIQRLGLGPADVVGHSYGGIVAALVARAHPELVRSLILIEPSLFGLIHDRRVGAETLSGFEDGRMRTLAQLASGKPALDVIREIFGSEAFDQFGELRRQIIVDNANTLAPSQAESWWALPFSCADARAFGMPVQLIEGATTFAAAREIQQELLRCVNDGQRVVLPRAGHTVQFDAPEATGRAILRFVTGGT
jgi:pimeloyl-ACP methyl ester carboxylesterase